MQVSVKLPAIRPQDKSLAYPSSQDAVLKFVYNKTNPETRRAYASEMKQFITWVKKSAFEVTPDDIQAYRDEIMRDRQPTTVLKKMVAIRRFFDFVQKRYGYPNPTETVDLPRVRNETTKEVLSFEDTEVLFKTLKKLTTKGTPQRKLRATRDLAIMALFLVNGLRVSEIAKAQVKDLVNIDSYNVLKVHGKGGKERDAKLRDDVYQAIQDYLSTRGGLGDTDYLFVGLNHRANSKLDTRSIRMRANYYLRKCGLKRDNITTHSFRHTAITYTCLNPRAKVEQVMEFAGHSDPRVTMRYFHNFEKLKNNAVDLNPISV